MTPKAMMIELFDAQIALKTDPNQSSREGLEEIMVDEIGFDLEDNGILNVYTFKGGKKSTYHYCGSFLVYR